MNWSGFPELIEQALVIRLALRIVTPVVMILTGVTLAALVVYLLGVCQLCRAESRPGK